MKQILLFCDENYLLILNNTCSFLYFLQKKFFLNLLQTLKTQFSITFNLSHFITSIGYMFSNQTNKLKFFFLEFKCLMSFIFVDIQDKLKLFSFLVCSWKYITLKYSWIINLQTHFSDCLLIVSLVFSYLWESSKLPQGICPPIQI